MPDFTNGTEIQPGIENARRHGAAAVSLFGTVSDGVLAALKTASSKVPRAK